jgi:6-phosphogluconolactonase/glucosamine-6-phosphate isomerase/deaminase
MMNDKVTKRSKAAQVRTTLVLPDVLDRNLEIWCALNGRSKADVVKEALSSFLSQRGLQPDKRPRTEVNY